MLNVLRGWAWYSSHDLDGGLYTVCCELPNSKFFTKAMIKCSEFDHLQVDQQCRILAKITKIRRLSTMSPAGWMEVTLTNYTEDYYPTNCDTQTRPVETTCRMWPYCYPECALIRAEEKERGTD